LKEYLGNKQRQDTYFAGFNALNKLESFYYSGKKYWPISKADIFGIGDAYFVEDPIHDAGYFIKGQHQNTWPWLKGKGLKGVGKTNYFIKKNI